jgi:hypothetical protein
MFGYLASQKHYADLLELKKTLRTWRATEKPCNRQDLASRLFSIEVEVEEMLDKLLFPQETT